MKTLGSMIGTNPQASRQAPAVDIVNGGERTRVPTAKPPRDGITEAQQLLSEKLRQRLSEKLSAVGESAALPTENDDADFSPARVADRILGFIESRLSREKAAGSTDPMLMQRLQQGVEGVFKGMQEARDELEGRGMFDGAIRDNYFETFGRVQQGLDALKKRFAPTDAPSVPAKPALQQPASETSALEKTARIASTPTVTATDTAWQGQRMALGETRDFTIEVSTKEGDVIKISVSSMRAFSAANAHLQTPGGSASLFTADMSQEDSFSFSVEGELNEGERKALGNLLAQVNEVAATFYGGNVEQAFTQALAIGYDQNELAGFAANMSQSQTIALTETYGSVARAGGARSGQPLGELLAPLIDFARQMRQSEQLLKSSEASLPGSLDFFRKMLGELPAAAVNAGDKPDIMAPWRQFVDRLSSSPA